VAYPRKTTILGVFLLPTTQQVFEGDLECCLAVVEAGIHTAMQAGAGEVRPHEIWNTPGATEPWRILCKSIRFNPNRPAPFPNGVDASGGDRQRIDRKRQLDWFPRPDQDAYVLTRSARNPCAGPSGWGAITDAPPDPRLPNQAPLANVQVHIESPLVEQQR